MIARRLLALPFALVAVLSAVFFCLLATGDPVDMLAPPQATNADKAQMRHDFGLDRPLPYQLGVFLLKAAHGDFGHSLFEDRPALQLALERFPNSLELALGSTLLAIVIGVPLGVLAATARRSVVDQAVMGFALVGQSMASFWLALLLILLFAVQLRWLPVSGNSGPQSLILPSLALSFWLMALLARLTRSEMVEVLAEDCVRTASAKGLPRRVILIRHALRNALIPLVTMIGVSLGWQFGGAVVIEYVFGWPGLGSLLLEAVLRRDYPLVLAGVAILATLFIVINLLVDVLYTLI
ncbi:MAG: ABC transporter permease, partial [Chloroflexota bacterium]